MLKFYKGNLLLLSKKIKEGDLVFIEENIEKNESPFEIISAIKTGVVETERGGVFRDDSVKRVYKYICFDGIKREKSIIDYSKKVSELRNYVNDLSLRLKRESVIISKTELNALISILPDANLVGSKKIVESDLKKLNTVYQYERIDKTKSKVVLEFKEIVIDKDKKIKGVKFTVNGKDVLINLMVGKFYFKFLEVNTYYWSIWPSILSDEAWMAMSSALESIKTINHKTDEQ